MMPTVLDTLRTPTDLVAAGLAGEDATAALARVAERYAIAITPAMAALVDRSDPDDPIARQLVPHPDELNWLPEELADPIGDERHEKVAGLVHRYPDRVLLKLTHACPVYCRFCFRREVVGPGGEASLSKDKLDAALAYIARDTGIFEVILTGGDPLILSPRRIADVTRRLAAIDHVQVLRWHTRVPVADPHRVTPELVAALRTTRAAVYVAVHANHPRELSAAARAACARLVDAGIPLLSQTVLLRGVNDDVETLAELMRAFIAARIKPYYLHHMDLAPGTNRFRTPIAEGQALMRQLRGRLSGIAQPTYVVDVPGGYGKVPVGPSHLEAGGIRDSAGTVHAHPDA